MPLKRIDTAELVAVVVAFASETDWTRDGLPGLMERLGWTLSPGALWPRAAVVVSGSGAEGAVSLRGDTLSRVLLTLAEAADPADEAGWMENIGAWTALCAAAAEALGPGTYSEHSGVPTYRWSVPGCTMEIRQGQASTDLHIKATAGDGARP